MTQDPVLLGETLVAVIASALRTASFELLLFASAFIILFGVGDVLVDAIWIGNRKLHRDREKARPHHATLHRMAVFIPAWQESEVIGRTLSHIRRSWSGDYYRLYVGCYANDSATLLRVAAMASVDPKVRIVVHKRAGPSTKADCLNAIWQALREDEVRDGDIYDAVILHDAEDFVDPDELAVFDEALQTYAFVQLPVVPMAPVPRSWIAGHYCDEFAEAHQKDMPVRVSLSVPVPAAGVGCAFRRDALESVMKDDGPFNADSLVEDYELGLMIGARGLPSAFVRKRNNSGNLIGVRSFFPDSLDWSVRQKARWVAGIALSGWDNLGWTRGLSLEAISSNWMLWRDRRVLIGALVTMAAYGGAVLLLVSETAGYFVRQDQRAVPDTLASTLAICTLILCWRLVMRGICTTRVYGLRQGLLSIPRAVVSNLVAVLASRRALTSYVRSLAGTQMIWDKTHHPAAHNPFYPPKTGERQGDIC